jgi:hypothetical protein
MKTSGKSTKEPLKPLENQNTGKTINKKSRARKYLFLRILISLVHISPVVFIIGALIFFSTEPYTTANIIVGIFLGIINLSFFTYATFLKKDEIQEITYTAYFTLMIFNVGIFPLFNYIKDYQERNKVEVLYTVGFRSWGSEVVYSNIKVNFYDKFGNPYTLADSIVNDPKNWLIRWNHNEMNELKLEADTAFDVKEKKMSLSLTNCGAILNPEVYIYRATSFSVSANIHFVQVDPFYLFGNLNERYESSQICLKVPYYLNSERSDDVDYESASGIYYGFELPFWNFSWSKLRIPAFNFDYTEAELYYRMLNDPNDKYARHIIKGIKETILNDTINEQVSPIAPGATIRLSSSLIGDNASFYLFKTNSTHSLPLFNFRIPDYAEIDLK